MCPAQVTARALHAEFAALVRALQDALCEALERADGSARFGRDRWQHAGGGGGLTRVLADGALLEKGAVNVSDVAGEVPETLAGALPGEARSFTAAGISVVLHPQNPFVPAFHANLRFIARGERAGFGGGADLTPAYLFDEDAAHFHRTLRGACDAVDGAFYPRLKRACDDYFLLRHRGERRGVGGIFFEHLEDPLEKQLALVREVGRALLPAWLPIAERRRSTPFGDRERDWQELRRGRYAEFNLLLDRGTRFGLETAGRVESILVSMPPRARWAYGYEPAPGSEEARLLAVLRNPREWA